MPESSMIRWSAVLRNIRIAFELTDCNKHAILLQYSVNYGRKKVYKTGSRLEDVELNQAENSSLMNGIVLLGK